jgi:hypothetical protein
MHLLVHAQVIRQEIVFIAGQDDSLMLSALVDAIKFCWSGETPIQVSLLRNNDPHCACMQGIMLVRQPCSGLPQGGLYSLPRLTCCH